MRRHAEAFRALVSGCAVYVILAACSGPVDEGPRRRGNLGVGGRESDEAGFQGGAAAGSQEDGSIFDAMTSPVPDARAQTSSGSRIKAKYLTSSDGAKQWQGWFDSERKEDCAFQLASDGSTRCLPSSAGSTGLLFADATCTVPVALFPKGCGAATSAYVLQVNSAQCPQTTTVRTRGAAYSAPGAYMKSLDKCYEYVSSSLTALLMTYDAFSVGSEVPASSFVAAQSTTD